MIKKWNFEPDTDLWPVSPKKSRVIRYRWSRIHQRPTRHLTLLKIFWWKWALFTSSDANVPKNSSVDLRICKKCLHHMYLTCMQFWDESKHAMKTELPAGNKMLVPIHPISGSSIQFAVCLIWSFNFFAKLFSFFIFFQYCTTEDSIFIYPL